MYLAFPTGVGMRIVFFFTSRKKSQLGWRRKDINFVFALVNVSTFCHATFSHCNIFPQQFGTRQITMRLFLTLTICHDDILSGRQFITATIYHYNNLPWKQFVTKTICHNENLSRQFVTTTICRKKQPPCCTISLGRRLFRAWQKTTIHHCHILFCHPFFRIWLGSAEERTGIQRN